MVACHSAAILQLRGRCRLRSLTQSLTCPHHACTQADPTRFNAVLRGALWKESVLRLKAQAQVGAQSLRLPCRWCCCCGSLLELGAPESMSPRALPVPLPPLLLVHWPACRLLPPPSNKPALPAATTQEYNGEVRPRYAVADVRQTDYAGECRRLLALIAAPAAAAATVVA